MKKWFIPLIVVRSHELPFFIAAYAMTGRFNPDHEVRNHPVEQQVTSQVDWKSYEDRFKEILDTALNDGVFASSAEVKNYFRELDRTGVAQLDDSGLPMLTVSGRQLGLSRANLLSAKSDPLLSYQLMLARLRAVLDAPVGRRESGVSFEKDWDLMLRSRERMNSAGN